MRKFILLFSILACMQVNAEAKSSSPLDRLINEHITFCKLDKSKLACCPVYYPIGPKGAKGCKGERGRQGQRGPTGTSLEINNYIEVTTVYEGLIFDSELIRFDPISTVSGFNGIQASIPTAIALVESNPGSGNFDTITLPIESEPTLYAVTHGASVDSSIVDFQLVLNGIRLPYTDLSLFFEPSNTMLSRTSVILNPANTTGTLNVVSISSGAAFLEPPLEGGFSAYVTVVKLNNLGP